MKTTKKIVSVFLYVILIVLLFGMIGLMLKYVDNRQRDFYVKYGNETLVNEKTGIELPKNIYSVFYCNTLTGQSFDYDVQVFLNVKNFENFDFSVDNNRKNFKNDFTEYDCAELFSVSKFDTYFILFVPNGISVEKIIQLKYPGTKITDIPNINLDINDIFILTVMNNVEKLKTQIYFY